MKRFVSVRSRVLYHYFFFSQRPTSIASAAINNILDNRTSKAALVNKEIQISSNSLDF